MKKFIILLIVCALALVFILTTQSPSQPDDTIVIGAPLSLTGMASVDGQSIKRGVDLAQEDLAKKGINVRIVYEDDSSNPKQTVAAVQKLAATEPKMQAMIGPTWSFLLEASAATIKQDKIISYSPAITSEIIRARSPHIIFGAIKNERMAPSIANWLRSVQAKKVGIIVSNDAWGQSIEKPFIAATKESGTQVMLIERIPDNSEAATIAVVVAKMKSQHVDAILWTGYEKSAIALSTKLEESGMHVNLLSASNLLFGLTQNKSIKVRPDSNYYYMTTQVQDEFAKKYTAKYKQFPTTYADSAYDGVMMIAHAIKNKKSQSLVDYLRSNNFHYSGYQTDYSFDGNGDIRGGEWIVKKI